MFVVNVDTYMPVPFILGYVFCTHVPMSYSEAAWLSISPRIWKILDMELDEGIHKDHISEAPDA